MVASKDGFTPDRESTPHFNISFNDRKIEGEARKSFLSSFKSLILNLKGEIFSAEFKGSMGTIESLQEAQTIVLKQESLLVSALPASEGLCGPTEGAS